MINLRKLNALFAGTQIIPCFKFVVIVNFKNCTFCVYFNLHVGLVLSMLILELADCWFDEELCLHWYHLVTLWVTETDSNRWGYTIVVLLL